ncbi:MAG: tagaturonate reductase, partial [Bacteroidota bacterium]
GSLLRRTILQYASHWGLEADFVSWVNLHNHFCDTLVDRIVSGYDAKVAEDISDQLAFPDPNLVVGEHYHSWVIKSEASIRDQLPFLASGLNNSWTDDLQLYRQRKVRILNGAHMTIVPLGHMLGLKTVKEAMDHPALSNFLEALLSEEVIPSIDLDEEQLQAYKEDILDRFRNPFLEHRLLDIALNSISKFAARLLPTLVDRYQQTGQIPHKILRVWLAVILFYRGTYQGAEIPLRDEESNLRFFADLWQKSQAFREAEILQHALQHALQCPAWQHDQLPPREQLLAEMLPLWQQWEQEGLLSLISTPQTSN